MILEVKLIIIFAVYLVVSLINKNIIAKRSKSVIAQLTDAEKLQLFDFNKTVSTLSRIVAPMLVYIPLFAAFSLLILNDFQLHKPYVITAIIALLIFTTIIITLITMRHHKKLLAFGFSPKVARQFTKNGIYRIASSLGSVLLFIAAIMIFV
jgi:hypothetical protein